LGRARAAGGDVRVVYSPADAVAIARRNPDRQVVFFGVGFETTAPANAMAVWLAARDGVANFSLLSSHVLVPPAVRLLLSSPRNRVQGFIAPGHVCTVMGSAPYATLAGEFRVPFVVGGFEPVDLLEAIAMLVDQLEDGRTGLENQYVRSVTADGNGPAQRLMDEVFEVCDRKWRGIGPIPASGLRLRPAFARFDAQARFGLADAAVDEPAACVSAEVLQGLKRPTDCAMFATRCAPDTPLGAPMVSAEGACAAYYRYRRPAAAM
jgi:hydrogenase expression/formation protein HypD